MRRLHAIAPLVFGLFLLGASSYLLAQQLAPGATPVQSLQPLYSCDQAFTATGLGNATVTLTVPGQAGRVFYICAIDIQQIANAAVTGAAGPAQLFTTTNLVNNLVWWGSNTTLVIGATINVMVHDYGVAPVKTLLPGTAFTIVGTGGQSTLNVRMNVTGFYGTP